MKRAEKEYFRKLLKCEHSDNALMCNHCKLDVEKVKFNAYEEKVKCLGKK
jgi:hypothetical protein